MYTLCIHCGPNISEHYIITVYYNNYAFYSKKSGILRLVAGFPKVERQILATLMPPSLLCGF